MRSRKRVEADTPEQLQVEAELHFPPGSRYQVFRVKEQRGGSLKTWYRAEVRRGGPNATSVRAAVTSRPGSGREQTVSVNPDTVTELPSWRPQAIPASVLQDGPQSEAVAALLIGGGTVPDSAGPHGSPAQVVDLTGLLDRASDATRHQPTQHLVIAGLLDDSVYAAELLGHRRWSAAGALNGGQAGAEVTCYGLGGGEAIRVLAEGLAGMASRAPLRLLLAADPSRKHADTQRWVHELAEIIRPDGIIPVRRVHTATPETLHAIGLPLVNPPSG